MKTLKKRTTAFIAAMMSFPFLLMAQDEGTFIDDMGAQDSSYMENDLLAESAQSSGSGTTTIIIIVAAVIVIAAVFFFLKKKKKQ